MKRPATPAISPCFIVNNIEETVAFYAKLGFAVTFQEPQQNPFFAVICRDGAQLFVKAVSENTPPLPNSTRHRFAPRWDAYVFAPDPDALATEFLTHGAIFSTPLEDTHDGLRGFEIKDPNGYVLFFGRPK